MRKTRIGRLKRQKGFLTICVFTLLLFFSVGYATFSTTITLNAKGNIKKCHNGKKWYYAYDNKAQEFTAPCGGTYKFELWGADSYNAKGGYVSGILSLNSNQKFYLYVGEKGHAADTDGAGGFNGGGNAIVTASGKSGTSGGGATDVRTTGGQSDSFDSLKSRIMVAGGAGGSGGLNASLSSSAGGLDGYDGYNSNSNYLTYLGKGGTQIAGGLAPQKYSAAQSNGTAGLFGLGGSGGMSINTASTGGGSGGGAGYFGGSGASGLSNGTFAAGGGSSFISGHSGCVAIDENSTVDNIIFKQLSGNVSCADNPTGQYCSHHYSNFVFSDTLMIDGTGHVWTTTVGGEMTIPSKTNSSGSVDSSGNGYAIVTLVSMS